MGCWGEAAWDNDSAADWFAEFMDKSKIVNHIEDTLNLDSSEYADEIRAACSVLVFLGRTYVWPVKKLEANLKLAISKLEEISRNPDYEDEDDLLIEIKSEIEILKSRIPQSEHVISAAAQNSWSSWIR